ncbi:MAG: hypothetical protein MUC65_10440 [Pontiellaceae bacterium]|nr:hypothetical protein [Pontiellaceae bacterium]
MNIIKAGGDDLVWLIVGVFWVIAQIAGGISKKNKRRPPATAASGEQPEPAENQLSDLLRQLSGQQPVEIPLPDYAELMGKQESTPENHWSSNELAALPVFSGKAEPPPLPPPVLKPVAEVPKIDIRPTMKAFRNASVAMKQPSMNLRIQGLEKRAEKIPMCGHIINPADRNSLRRAMLSHIILSKPKGMERL